MNVRSQRQDHRRTRWKAPGDVFEPRHHEVAPIADDGTARVFVEAHHYAGSYPAAAHRFGLYQGSALVGVAVYSVGTNPKTITNVFGGAVTPWQDAFELGRFVLRDAVPYNAESWFLARTFELLRAAGVAGIVSFSDPYPRRRQDGSVAFPGHIGTIYAASNAAYTGRGTARTLRLFSDGTVFSDRTAQKIRQLERGYQAAIASLVARGAEPLTGDRHAWLERAIAQLTRPVRHPGNHRYVFSLARRPLPILPAILDRPRQPDYDQPGLL